MTVVRAFVFFSIGLLTAVINMSASQETPVVDLKIITRSEWNARPASRVTKLSINPPSYVIIHHSATESCASPETCSASVRSFQDYHMDGHKWDDIGYNFVVGEDGNIYEGRGWGITGAHATVYNSKSIGICIIGTFIDRLPNETALATVKKLISFGVSSKIYRMSWDHAVRGNPDLAPMDGKSITSITDVFI